MIPARIPPIIPPLGIRYNLFVFYVGFCNLYIDILKGKNYVKQ